MYLIGQSIDFHQIEKAKPLILGGLKLKDNNGLKAYSDGDIILHVIAEAILGSIQKGDLGDHFPSSDLKHKNISSIKILNHSLKLLKNEGYKIQNIDLTFISDDIMISQYRDKILNHLKELINCDKINLKGTTSDNILYAQKKYVICQCVILVWKV